MNKTAQISLPIFILFSVLVSGYILSIFSPTINQVRLDQLALTADVDVFEKLILYSLMPLIWGVYVVFSVFAVIWASNSAGQGF
jgi:hypothetical protein